MIIQAPFYDLRVLLKSDSRSRIDPRDRLSSNNSRMARKAFVFPEPFSPIRVLTPSAKRNSALLKCENSAGEAVKYARITSGIDDGVGTVKVSHSAFSVERPEWLRRGASNAKGQVSDYSEFWILDDRLKVLRAAARNFLPGSRGRGIRTEKRPHINAFPVRRNRWSRHLGTVRCWHGGDHCQNKRRIAASKSL